MTDPFAAAKAFGLVNEARKAGFDAFRRWKNRDVFAHLARLLGDRFEGDPFLAGQDWTFLRTQADVVEILDAFFVDQTPLRPTLPAALTKYLDPVSDAAPSVEDLAERVTEAIESAGSLIWEEESDRIVYVMRAEMAEQLAVMEATHSNTEMLLEQGEFLRETLEDQQAANFDALPEDLKPYFDRLADDDRAAAQRLMDVLLAAPTIKEGVIGLIVTPQSWIAEAQAPGSVWAVLGRLATQFASWEAAERAYLIADEAGYPRRANTLSRASEAAEAQGKREEARALLERAEALDRRDPTVSIRAGLSMVDADEKLARLGEAAPTNDDERAAVEANRGAALLTKGEIEEAHAAAAHAVDLAPRFTYAKIVLAWAKNQRGAAAAPAGKQDIDDLHASAELLLSARETLDSLGRHSEALVLVSDICNAYFLARDQLRAVSLLEEIASDDQYVAEASAEARTAVAETAITLRRPDLADRLLPPESDSDDVRLARATLKVTSAEKAADIAIGAEALGELLASDNDGVRVQASLMRLAASTDKRADIAWSTDAERILRESAIPNAADGLRAQYLLRIGESQEAENILLQAKDPRSLGLLVHAALEAGDVGLAIQRAEALAHEYPSAGHSLDLAELLLQDGRVAEAEATLAALRRDEHVPMDIRNRAYFLSVVEVYKARRYDESEQLSAEWLELVPSETDAAWIRLESLLWLSRYDEALALIDEFRLDPSEIGKARMLAHVFLRALRPNDALAKVVELSDRFNRSDETLEGLVVVCYANAGKDVTDELAIRGSQTIAEFPDRFPNSRASARSVSLDELNELLRAKSQHDLQLGNMNNEVLAGRLPVVALSMASGQSLTALWTALRVLPIAFADTSIARDELAAAKTAIGAGAVWDPSALVTIELLDQATVDVIQQSLPRSVVAHATLQDVDYAAVDAAEGRREEEQSLAWDAAQQQPVLLVRDPTEVAQERQRVRAVLARARQLEVVPDRVSDQQTSFDAEIPEISNIESMGRAVLFGSLAAATRLGLPLFSDDRVVRVLAREGGIPAFGTFATIEALTERGLLTDEAKRDASARLAAAGAIELALDN